MENEKNVFLEIDNFISHITRELDASEFSGQILSLQSELKAAKIESEKTQNELIAYNDKKFDLLKEFVSSESDNVAHLQNIVDLLNTEITSEEPRQLIADNVAISDHTVQLSDTFNTHQENSPNDIQSIDSDKSSGLETARIALESKLSRMLSANAASTPANSAP